MDVEVKPPRVVVTAAWREEQQAKRDAYEAKRRAWVRTLERGAEVEEDQSPAPGEASPPDALGTRGAGVVPRRGRRGGTVHDKRQTRFAF
jgi:hypothetical protein